MYTLGKNLNPGGPHSKGANDLQLTAMPSYIVRF